MTQTTELTASDAHNLDVFGFAFGDSVGISGDTVVAGAPLASPNYENQGVAYVFVEPPTGWPSTMTQTAELNVTLSEALPTLDKPDE